MKLLSSLLIALSAFAQIPSVSDRAVVTIAAGQPVGGTIVSARTQVCSLLAYPQTLDSGFVEQILVEQGFAVTGSTEAMWVNQQFRQKDKRIIGAEIAQGAGWMTTGLIASKIIGASGPWGAAATFGALGAGQLANFLRGQAPPDFATRYQNQPVMQDNDIIKLNGAMDPNGHACMVQVVFIDTAKTASALKSGKKIKALGNMRIRQLRSAVDFPIPSGTILPSSFIVGQNNSTGNSEPITVSSEVNIARSVWLSNPQ